MAHLVFKLSELAKLDKQILAIGKYLSGFIIYFYLKKNSNKHLITILIIIFIPTFLIIFNHAGSAIIFLEVSYLCLDKVYLNGFHIFIIYNILIATYNNLWNLLNHFNFIPSSILLLLLFNNMKIYIKTTLILISSGIALTLITNLSYNNLAPHQKDRM